MSARRSITGRWIKTIGIETAYINHFSFIRDRYQTPSAEHCCPRLGLRSLVRPIPSLHTGLISIALSALRDCIDNERTKRSTRAAKRVSSALNIDRLLIFSALERLLLNSVCFEGKTLSYYVGELQKPAKNIYLVNSGIPRKRLGKL